MAVNVERNRWVRNPEDFAVDLRQRDLSGLFKKAIFIEEGTIGLHLIQGRYDKRLEPGEHILEGALDTAILGGRDRKNIVLIHNTIYCVSTQDTSSHSRQKCETVEHAKWVAVARHGLILWENDATGSTSLFK